MKKLLVAAAVVLTLGGITAVYADGEWARSGPVWLKNVIYAGSGRVALTNATGNLSTTSGTFSGAVSAGSLSNSGAVTWSSLTAGITAGTGGQGNGAITTLAAQATVVTADNDVTIPTPAVGKLAMVCNADASDALDVFAPSGAQFNKESANAAIALAAGECMFCIGFSSTRYGCVIGSAN